MVEQLVENSQTGFDYNQDQPRLPVFQADGTELDNGGGKWQKT